MLIYAASSWRNQRLTAVIETLRTAGHQVYDFRRPGNHDASGSAPPAPFTWAGVGVSERPTAKDFLRGLRSRAARRQWKLDTAALFAADALVLVLPCGVSAHTAFGLGLGTGKRTLVLLDQEPRPELAYLEADFVTADLGALVRVLGRPPWLCRRTCPNCEGVGVVQHSDWRDWWREHDLNLVAEEVDCPVCGGRGVAADGQGTCARADTPDAEASAAV